MTQAVWVACATYAPHDDITPLVAVGVSSQDCQENLDNLVHDYCRDLGTDPDNWITHEPQERSLPDAMETDPSGDPTGVKAWLAAGIPQADIDLWFSNKIEEIGECAKDIAHDDASNMTVAMFKEEFGDMHESTISQLIWAQVPANIRERMITEWINGPAIHNDRYTADCELQALSPNELREHLRQAVDYEAPLLAIEEPDDLNDNEQGEL